MPSTYTTHYNFEKPGYDEQDEIWGTTADTNYDAIDTAIYNAAQAAASAVPTAAPTGMISAFDLASAPAGWVEHNGGTIGNASSGATLRANADTLALFTAMWAFSNTLRPIQNSSGAATSRGASAAADFAANKRIPVGNSTNRVLRHIGADAPALGDVQEDAMQRITGTVGTVLPTAANGSTYSTTGAFSTGTSRTVYSGAGASAKDVTFDSAGSVSYGGARTSTETRPKGYGVLMCIKL